MPHTKLLAVSFVGVAALVPVLGAARAEDVTAPAVAVSASASASASAVVAPPVASSAPAVSGAPVPATSVAPASSTPTTEPLPSHWYDGVKVGAFIDVYAGVNANFPKPNVNSFRAFDANDGFSMHWIGLDANVPAAPIGGTVSLRFGPSTTAYAGADAAVGLQYVKQAFATWKASGKLTLDFGKFDQPYGSEVADSQFDPNYTRSALYWYAQPLFHTGLRLDWAVSDAFDWKFLLVNGWNDTVDVNTMKTVGTQIAIKPSDALLVVAGYLVGPEQPDSVKCLAGTTLDAATAACVPSATSTTDTTFAIRGANSRLRHLVDLVVDTTPVAGLRFLFNADYGTEELISGRASWYGGNLVVGYGLSDVWSIAARGEWFVDAQGFMTATGKKTTIVDGTVTLGATPTKNLLLKLDLRLDHVEVGGGAPFPKGSSGETTEYQPTATLGVVATTN
jgi:hypothetical protein